MKRVEGLRLRVDRADPGDGGECARRLQEADAVAGGGASTITVS